MESKNSGGFFKGDAVFLKVSDGLLRVPTISVYTLIRVHEPATQFDRIAFGSFGQTGQEPPVLGVTKTI